MFPRCANTISSAPSTAAINKGRESLINHTKTGIIAAPTIDPSDTYLVVTTIARKTTPAHNTATGASTRKAPAPVATPLPPRNPNHTGKTWPTITATAAVATIQSFRVNISAMTTAAPPFNASSTRVTTPATFPARRETFVAPVPPDPVCLISAPILPRTIRYPNGIDPIRYATITTTIRVIRG